MLIGLTYLFLRRGFYPALFSAFRFADKGRIALLDKLLDGNHARPQGANGILNGPIIRHNENVLTVAGFINDAAYPFIRRFIHRKDDLGRPSLMLMAELRLAVKDNGHLIFNTALRPLQVDEIDQLAPLGLKVARREAWNLVDDVVRVQKEM